MCCLVCFHRSPGIDLSAFEAQIQQLEVGSDVGWHRLFGVILPPGFDASHQFAMAVDAVNEDRDVRHDIFVSVLINR